MLTKFVPEYEACTAAIVSHRESGENYDGAVTLGYYPASAGEIWIEFKGQRINIQLADVKVLCKELMRAKQMAEENATLGT